MNDDDDRKQAPFAAKNLAALKIGSRSPRVYGLVAEAITGDLLHDAPHLAAYPEELAALASTEAIVALIRIELAARGIGKGDGVRLALLDRYFRAEAAAAKRRDAIGLSPIGEAVLAERRASAAALAMSAGDALDALAARGTAALEARATATEPDLVVAVLDGERQRYAAEREATTAEWKTTTQTETTDEGNSDDNHD